MLRYFWKQAEGNLTHQFIGDPPHFRHFVRAKVKRNLSEVVIDVVVTVQLNDQDELSKYTDTDKRHKSEITLKCFKKNTE